MTSSNNLFLPAEIIPLGDKTTIGSESTCRYVIPNEQVTDLHAVIELRGGRHFIRDRRSFTGTLVNNRPITDAMLVDGDWISIGPVMFCYRAGSLEVYPKGQQFRIAGIQLKRNVHPIDPQTGQMRTVSLIDDVTVSIEPRTFTAIIGPSGSGKSTLLNAISGRVPADSGNVWVNDRNLLLEFDQLKRNMVLVPQKETIHEILPVRTILRHTARLRMPGGIGQEALEREVTRVLRVVGLAEEHHHKRFSILSGGQKKRVSLAHELIGNPQVVFLDEVTSGLDEEADGRLMALFRELAESGKTVVCITHNLANVERYCHRVIVLAKGGRLVHAGAPTETKQYFNVDNLGDVYHRLEKPAPIEVHDLSSGADQNDFDPNGASWRRLYDSRPNRRIELVTLNKLDESLRASPQQDPQFQPENRFTRIVRQTFHLARRYLDLHVADRNNLLAMAGTSILVAFLLIVVFGNVHVDPLPTKTMPSASQLETFTSKAADATMLLFLLEFSCLWFGCTSAAKEIVKEVDIYRLERNYFLDPAAYYLSKLGVLSILSLIQMSLLYFPVVLYCDPPGSGVAQFVTMASLTVLGVMVGLLISNFSPTVDTAATMVPIIMIPQFILAGAISTVTGFAKVLAYGAVLYWGHRGILASQPDFLTERLKDAPGWFVPHFMLGVHSGVYVTLALVIFTLKDRGRTTLDMIRLARDAMRDPQGPAARAWESAKSRLMRKSLD